MTQRSEKRATKRGATLKASPPLFERGYLDRLTRTRPAVLLATHLPIVGGLVALGFAEEARFVLALALMAAGFLFWTFAEYWIHRLVFHFEPAGRVGRRVHFVIHGAHHEHPDDPGRLLMPPAANVPGAAASFAIFWLLMGLPHAFAFSGGFVFGYVLYDLTHYYVHHARPRGGFPKYLRQLHMRHHFQDHDAAFGVSSPLWDKVFGTLPARRRSPRPVRSAGRRCRAAAGGDCRGDCPAMSGRRLRPQRRDGKEPN